MTLPEGYERIGGTPDVSAFGWSGVSALLARALREHGSLRAWAGSLADAEPLEGRGTVLAVDAPAPGPDGHPRWAVRSYLRGGAMAAWLGDRYLRVGTSRPEHELRASCAIRDRGVPTPAVVAGAVYRAHPFHYRADLITELVPSSVDLAAALWGGPGGDPLGDPTKALRASGALLARTAAAGIYHPDLNAKNIVLRTGSPRLTAHLIDLDRCRVRRRPRSSDEQAMRARLERSLQKHATRTGVPLTEAQLRALEQGIREGGSARPPSDAPGKTP
ncbi:MAG: lipopolysaccharide kinase InaA family protein [Gemmatimonadota bacterium]